MAFYFFNVVIGVLITDPLTSHVYSTAEPQPPPCLFSSLLLRVFAVCPCHWHASPFHPFHAELFLLLLPPRRCPSFAVLILYSVSLS